MDFVQHLIKTLIAFVEAGVEGKKDLEKNAVFMEKLNIAIKCFEELIHHKKLENSEREKLFQNNKELLTILEQHKKNLA